MLGILLVRGQKVQKVTESPFCAKPHFLHFLDFRATRESTLFLAGMTLFYGLPGPDSRLLLRAREYRNRHYSHFLTESGKSRVQEQGLLTGMKAARRCLAGR